MRKSSRIEMPHAGPLGVAKAGAIVMQRCAEQDLRKVAVASAKSAGPLKSAAFNRTTPDREEVPLASDPLGQSLFIEGLFLAGEPRFINPAAGDGQSIDIVLAEPRNNLGNAVGIGPN